MEDPAVILRPEGDDILVRLILYPRALDTKNGTLTDERFFGYSKLSDKDKKSPVIWSVGLLKILKTEAEVHAYGCRTADTAREERYKKAKLKDQAVQRSREPNYIGYYEFICSKMFAAVEGKPEVKVEQKTEHGETAHCNITMSPIGNIDKGEWSDAKTRFISALGTLIFGPKKWICVVDEDLRATLEKAILPPRSMNIQPVTLHSTPKIPSTGG